MGFPWVISNLAVVGDDVKTGWTLGDCDIPSSVSTTGRHSLGHHIGHDAQVHHPDAPYPIILPVAGPQELAGNEDAAGRRLQACRFPSHVAPPHAPSQGSQTRGSLWEDHTYFR